MSETCIRPSEGKRRPDSVEITFTVVVIQTLTENYRDSDGFIPLFRMIVFARSDLRNAMSRVADSVSFEPATVAALNNETH